MTPQEFQKIDKLYHYTKFDSAKTIIESNSLKFGRLDNMNDVYEAYKQVSDESLNADIDIKQIHEALLSYMQLSFTQDGIYKGYEISAMWGHYAEKGKGVCLVFDKKKLIKILPDGLHHNKVDYQIDFKGDITIDSNNLSESIGQNMNKFFFTKSKDWEYEQEYRVVRKVDDINSNVFLPLNDRLIAVILQYADSEEGVYDKYVDSIFSSQHFRILDKISDRNLLILEYGHFLEESNLRDEKGVCYSSSKDGFVDIVD